MTRCAGQLRTAGMGGVIGFDLPALLGVARVMAELLPYAERGLVKALNERSRRHGDQDVIDPAERQGL